MDYNYYISASTRAKTPSHSDWTQKNVACFSTISWRGKKFNWK